jgi:hypothetical protein
MRKLGLLLILFLPLAVSAQVVIPGTGGATVIVAAGVRTTIVPASCTGTDKVTGVTASGSLICNSDIGAVLGLKETPSGAKNGVNKVYTFTETIDVTHFRVFWNGVIQEETDDYTVSGASEITMILAPSAGDQLFAFH